MNAEREIARLRAAGVGWHTIAATLNREGVPTMSGRGQWWAATCRSVMDRPRHNAYHRAYRRRHQ